MGLPSSGNLSVKSAAGASRSISLEEDGNETGNKSMRTLLTSASKGQSMRQFLNYESTPNTPSSSNNFTQTNSTCSPLTYSLSWFNGVSNGDQTRIEYGVNSSNWTLLKTTSPNANSDSGSIGGLPSNQQLRLRVRKERTQGGNQYSSWATSNQITIQC